MNWLYNCFEIDWLCIRTMVDMN